MRFELDFTECGLVLRDILLQHVEQRFGLLRAHIDGLEVVDGDVIRRSLADAAEHQKEVPQVHANLHAVGIIFAVFRRVDELNLGGGGLGHRVWGNTGRIWDFLQNFDNRWPWDGVGGNERGGKDEEIYGKSGSRAGTWPNWNS